MVGRIRRIIWFSWWVLIRIWRITLIGIGMWIVFFRIVAVLFFENPIKSKLFLLIFLFKEPILDLWESFLIHFHWELILNCKLCIYCIFMLFFQYFIALNDDFGNFFILFGFDFIRMAIICVIGFYEVNIFLFQWGRISLWRFHFENVIILFFIEKFLNFIQIWYISTSPLMK